MVIIRLARGGSKKRPFYSILVADQRRSVRGRFIERVGFYNPIATGKAEKLHIDTARVDYWVKHGAKPSARVAQLCKLAATKSMYSYVTRWGAVYCWENYWGVWGKWLGKSFVAYSPVARNFSI